MRVGLRLCLHCGREAVYLRHAAGDEARSIYLIKIKEVEDYALEMLSRASPDT